MFDLIKRAWNWVTEKRSMSLRDPGLVELFGGRETASGARVTEATALNISVVHACVKILAETLASMPLGMVRKLPGGGKEDAPEHPLHELLANRPCPEMTAYSFREAMMGHLGLRGNCIAYIQRDGAGRPMELWPLRPDRVLPQRYNGKLIYTVFVPPSNVSGWSTDLDAWPFETHMPITLPSQCVFHVMNFSLNGVMGLSPVTMMRETMGVALAQEEHAARYFGNAARPGGILTHPGKLSPEAAARMRKSFEDIHLGLHNSHKLALLEEGTTWTQVGLDNRDSQFLEARAFQLEELARPYRMPLHMLSHLKNASYATVEQAGIDFSTHTMLPWVVRWEQEIYRQLFGISDRRQYCAEFDMDALSRGALKERYESYNVGRTAGFLSTNDVRRRERMNSIGPKGDIYLQPMNMVAAGEVVLKAGSEVAPDKPGTVDTTNESGAGAPAAAPKAPETPQKAPEDTSIVA